MVGTGQHEFLMRLATDLRDELEKLHKEGELIGELRSFPTGCCGYVTTALFHFLKEKKIKGNYVLGKKDITRGQITHAWLQIDGLVVDITADQFNQEQRQVVYVGPPDGWYASWEQHTQDDTQVPEGQEERQIMTVLNGLQ